MRTMKELLADHSFFADLAPETIELCAGCATNAHFDPDEYLFRLGDPADSFYALRTGRVALELFSAHHGTLIIDTVDAGEVVGWSWLVAPYRWFFDARAIEPTSVIVMDGSCLRAKCEADSRLGFELMQRISQVMYQRLQSARVRLLDLYRVPASRVY
jgi:CRP-like cAMP-binding protein